MVWLLHFGNPLYIPLRQEAVLGVSVDSEGHISVGLVAEEVHKTVGRTSMNYTKPSGLSIKLQCILLLLTWGCLPSPPASQRTGSRSKSSCRLLASSSLVRSVQRSVRRHNRIETNPYFNKLSCVAANKRTLARCDILDTGKSSMATTTPS